MKEERKRQRELRDNVDENDNDSLSESEHSGSQTRASSVLRVLKNNKIMSQVLRNKHGNLERTKIEQIIESIANSGLCVVNSILKDEEEVARVARSIIARFPDFELEETRLAVEFLSFLWTMVNIEFVVESINAPEIRDAVNTVVRRKGTPAHDLVGYFALLDSATRLSERERNGLDNLLKGHKDPFIQQVATMRTQHYMNTHSSPAQIEQAICSRLGIKYIARPWARQE